MLVACIGSIAVFIENVFDLLQKQMFMVVTTPKIIIINNNEENSDLHGMLHA